MEPYMAQQEHNCLDRKPESYGKLLSKKIPLCYLCGNTLSGKIDRDHVPMKQLYGKEFRKISNPNLFCLPTHAKCNRQYQFDEDYFVYSLVPAARWKQTGEYVSFDVEERAKRGEQKPLIAKVLGQFEDSIRDTSRGVTYVPLNKDRIFRVIWKIARGLYFKETGLYISEFVDKVIKIYTEDDTLPDPIKGAIRELPGKGDYPTVFDYRYIVVGYAHCFFMSLWDSYTFKVIFHLPDCSCGQCKK